LLKQVEKKMTWMLGWRGCPAEEIHQSNPNYPKVVLQKIFEYASFERFGFEWNFKRLQQDLAKVRSNLANEIQVE
jgi:hypothetical protein